ncbi:hypothetical protein ABZ281_31940, partial [Streptomyces sp. NPDC006265]
MVGELAALLSIDDSSMQPDLRRAERTLQQSGQRMGDDAADAGQQAGRNIGDGVADGLSGLRTRTGLPYMAPRLLAAGLVLAGALAASACGPLTAPGSTAQAAPAAVGGGTALAQLNDLTVRAQIPVAGYSRDAFGPAWSDAGTVEMSGNSCPTRQEVLARDLDDVVRAGDGCTVLSGVLHDRYTGRTI